jgi:hypothetical protein
MVVHIFTFSQVQKLSLFFLIMCAANRSAHGDSLKAGRRSAELTARVLLGRGSTSGNTNAMHHESAAWRLLYPRNRLNIRGVQRC